MNRIKTHIKTLTTPRLLTPQDGIHFWQEKVLLNLLLVSVVLGFLTWCPSVLLAIKEKLWLVAGLDTLMLAWVMVLFFKPNLSYHTRAISIPLISYVLGMVLTLTLGPFGAGPVWLFFFPILTGVLLGARAASWSLAVNALTVVALGMLIHLDIPHAMSGFNIKAWYLTPENSLEKWVVICFNFLFLNILATLSVTTILNGLHKSLQELKLSDKKHRQIYENILDVYFETSLDGTILEISPSVEQISSYSQEELVGSSLHKVYESPAKRKMILNRLMTKGSIHDQEVQLRDKTGKIFTCSIKARLLRNENNEPDRIIGIFRDISKQKTMARMQTSLEERLNQSRKMEALGLLAGGVAHDLNNVLSGIVTYPNLLLMDLPKNSPMAHALNLIQSSGQRAAEIVQDLLALSRRGVVVREVVNLNDIVGEFLRTLEYEQLLSYHAHVQVETDLSAGFPYLKGSSVHLIKTIMNLMSNAAEAQVDGGLIRISTFNLQLDKPSQGYDHVPPGEYVVLRVEDQGQGIEPEDLKRIFEPFFTKKVMGRSGTGLGMAVVWGTIQDHGGYIDVNSKPGKGTRFDLYFPLTREMKEVKPDKASLEELSGNGETILIVDDVAQQREIAEVLLQRLGYETLSAAGGEEAVNYLKSEHADLVLLDMIMEPGMDGLETFRKIKQFKPEQKAILVSGFSHTQNVKAALDLGAGQYLKKPFTIEEMGRAVQKQLSGPGSA